MGAESVQLTDVEVVEVIEMKTTDSFATLIFVVILSIGVGLTFAMYGISANWESISILIGVFITALLIFSAIRIADQCNRAVVLRLGRFRAVKGPGLFFIVPIIDTVPYLIDTRVITATFQGREDANQGYGAGGCGRSAVLESLGPQEGGPRCG